MKNLRQDVQFAFRMLLKNPGFSVTAVLTLALGIGATTAIFSVVNAALLRPLPYAEPDRLVSVWGKLPSHGLDKMSTSVPEFGDYREQSRMLSSIAAYGSMGVNLTGGGEPERVTATFAVADLIPLLGVQPMLGRPFTPEEDRDGKDNVVVLGHGLWQRRFGGNPNAVGQTLTVNGQPCTIVGVMPASFRFPSAETELWKPAAFTPDQFGPNERGSHWLRVVGRLKPDVSLDQARTEMTAIAGRLQERFPEQYEPGSGWDITVTNLHDELAGDIRPTLTLMAAAVGFLLLIACANAGSLVLARVTTRRRELATRIALGAGRLRLLGQTAAESAVLVALGGGLGFVLSVWGKSGLVALLRAAKVPGLEDVGFDLRVFLFMSAVAVGTVTLFTIPPAFAISKFNLSESLREGRSGGTGSIERTRFRTFLVAVQTAAAVVVLVCAGLTGRSLYRLSRVDPGFNPDNVLAVRLSLPRAKYGEPLRQRAFFEQLTAKLKTLPGVDSVGAVNALPLTNTAGERNFSLKDHPESPVNVEFRLADPDYFKTMGMKLDKGRFFTDRDREGSPRVALVNETFVRMFLPNENPLDQHVKPGGGKSPYEWASIVGVVKDVKNGGVDAATAPEMYVPVEQPPLPDWTVNSMFVVVRGRMSPAALIPTVRGAVRGMDADLPVYNVASVEQLLSDSKAVRRFNAVLPGVFGGLALLLAAVGLHGVLSFFVTQRTREIGIRMALGARKGDMVGLVVRQGMVPACAGIVAGLVCARGIGRLMESVLFNVAATDVPTFVCVPLGLLAVAVLAAWLPARRATQVEPIVALRCE